jgi:hypothetical protein
MTDETNRDEQERKIERKTQRKKKERKKERENRKGGPEKTWLKRKEQRGM